MASLYVKKNSPFWYIEFVDKDGKKINRSTKLRRDDRHQTIEAKKLVNDMEAASLERRFKETSIKWGDWVDKFFIRRCKSKLTLERYRNCWKWLTYFFVEKKIIGPAYVFYKTALDYLEWRTGYVKKTGKSVGKNTSLMEVKVLSLVMQEAVRLEYINANPVQKLGISRDTPDEKRPLEDEEIIACRKALINEPDWMRYSFEIGLLTGCRLRETAIPLRYINLERNTITFPSPKGGNKKSFSVPIRNDLRPTIEEMVKRKYVVEFPFQPSRRWGQFFNKIGLKDICFHCLRVTFVTRLALKGVPLPVAMKLVNHGSDLVHRIYIRLNVEDLREHVNSTPYPSVSFSTSGIQNT